MIFTHRHQFKAQSCDRLGLRDQAKNQQTIVMTQKQNNNKKPYPWLSTLPETFKSQFEFRRGQDNIIIPLNITIIANF